MYVTTGIIRDQAAQSFPRKLRRDRDVQTDRQTDKPVGDWFARCLTICDIGVSLHLWAYVDISK